LGSSIASSLTTVKLQLAFHRDLYQNYQVVVGVATARGCLPLDLAGIVPGLSNRNGARVLVSSSLSLSLPLSLPCVDTFTRVRFSLVATFVDGCGTVVSGVVDDDDGGDGVAIVLRFPVWDAPFLVPSAPPAVIAAVDDD
jgi:hypothetical protein